MAKPHFHIVEMQKNVVDKMKIILITKSIVMWLSMSDRR